MPIGGSYDDEDLTGATLAGTYVSVSFRRTKLIHAHLPGTFIRCDFRGADLRGANLTGGRFSADFRGSNLTDHQKQQASSISFIEFPDG